MDSTVESFLETAALGSIVFGLDADSVRSLLGPPEDVGLQSRSRVTLLLKYGDLQLGFGRDKRDGVYVYYLHGIHVYFQDGEARVPTTLHGGAGVLTVRESIEEFLSEVTARGLAPEPELLATDEEGLAYVVRSDVSIYANRGTGQITSLQYGGPRKAVPKKRNR